MKIKPHHEARALIALHSASKQQGLGLLQTDKTLSIEEAAQFLGEHDFYADYCGGRVIKVDFSTDELDLRLFDRDNGEWAGVVALDRAGIIDHPEHVAELRTMFPELVDATPVDEWERSSWNDGGTMVSTIWMMPDGSFKRSCFNDWAIDHPETTLEPVERVRSEKVRWEKCT